MLPCGIEMEGEEDVFYGFSGKGIIYETEEMLMRDRMHLVRHFGTGLLSSGLVVCSGAVRRIVLDRGIAAGCLSLRRKYNFCPVTSM